MLQQDEVLKELNTQSQHLLQMQQMFRRLLQALAAKVDVLTQHIDKGQKDAHENIEGPPPDLKYMRLLQ